MNLTVYTQNVYEPYATSHFKAHSLLATGSIVAGIVRIVSYPLLAKLANVSYCLWVMFGVFADSWV